jgi:hypothetical protein
MDRIDNGVVVTQQVAGVQYWITFVGKSHSAVFHTKQCFGEHAPPNTFVVMVTGFPIAGGTWWSWLEPPGSDQYYPVEFTYIPPREALAGVLTPPGLTWTNYDFSHGVKNCSPSVTPAPLPATWTQIVVRLKHDREPVVLKKDGAEFVVQGVPANTQNLKGLLVANHSEWTSRLADVAYVYNEAFSLPPVASDSGLPTTPLAILVDVTTNATIAVSAWSMTLQRRKRFV